MKNRKVELTFDLLEDYSPLRIGMDEKGHCTTDYGAILPTLTLNRATEKESRVLSIYFSGDSSFDMRGRLAILPTVGGLISKAVGKIRPKTLAKRLNRLTKRPN